MKAAIEQLIEDLREEAKDIESSAERLGPDTNIRAIGCKFEMTRKLREVAGKLEEILDWKQ